MNSKLGGDARRLSVLRRPPRRGSAAHDRILIEDYVRRQARTERLASYVVRCSAIGYQPVRIPFFYLIVIHGFLIMPPGASPFSVEHMEVAGASISGRAPPCWGKGQRYSALSLQSDDCIADIMPSTPDRCSVSRKRLSRLVERAWLGTCGLIAH